MKLDYPLTLINQKLPLKDTAFYIKVILGIFFASILLFALLMGIGLDERLSSNISGVFFLSIIPCFLALILAHLYNNKHEAIDSVTLNFPWLTSLKIVNTFFSGIRRIVRGFTIVYAYLLLLVIIIFPILMVFSLYES